MNIRLYDSKAGALVDFTPREAGKVGMYVCGPTVQSSPHIGHLRSALAYDLWRRWFTYRGLDVTFVRNVTDIDDKVLVNASEGDPWWAVAYRVELEFTGGYNALGILAPTYEPRATASVPGMQELIVDLIATGNAYVADDGTGDVFFSVTSWPSYGALTNQKPGDMEASGDAATRGKRDPRDFALWKGTKPGEPPSASWNSPWGPGRPGWHIECSAMSRRYLGPAFDIHGGGLDLRFPHHENELAQSTAAGDAFATHWVHNGLVVVDGQKMSKSLGNSIYAAEFLSLARPIVVRYYLGSAHYRSTIDYHEGSLVEAEAAFTRIEGFLDRVARAVEATPEVEQTGVLPVPNAFATAMDDDLGVPQALAVLHEAVRQGNAALDAKDVALAARLRAEVVSMLGVLGLDPAAPAWASDDAGGADATLASLVEHLIGQRETARASKNFVAADSVRDTLAAAGITLEDGPDGTRWTL
ncbi:cysteine--tRNA ligase [Pseudolysinimonas sp.]|uniref:cysteine--tRNA ligase n=1 Tax=Pseudolysinimonas sp. TaxID=2680009 RepID=UPI00286C1052|nr:cysteine--tRNA ligase [Pseudolysinimonas sp.]